MIPGRGRIRRGQLVELKASLKTAKGKQATAIKKSIAALQDSALERVDALQDGWIDHMTRKKAAGLVDDFKRGSYHKLAADKLKVELDQIADEYELDYTLPDPDELGEETESETESETETEEPPAEQPPAE